MATNRAPRIHVDEAECTRVAGLMELVGRRWASVVLVAMGAGAERFTQIEQAVEGLSSRMLALRLRDLEQGELVERVVTPTTPVSITYHLTPRGQEMLRSLQAMSRVVRGPEPDGAEGATPGLRARAGAGRA